MTSKAIKSTLFSFFLGFRDSLLGTVTVLSIDNERRSDGIKKSRPESYTEVERPPGRRGPRPKQGKEYVYCNGSQIIA